MVAEDSMNWKQKPGQSRDEFQAAIQKAYKEVLDLSEEDKDYYVEQLNECLMYESHGLSFFGWVVDPVTVKAVQWGRDKLFEEMRNVNATALKAQSVDYGTMIHTQYM
ncbi:hypothetical protein GYMLUDRAFT_250207 [Collybiopsis luxurians FD-317 M1]|uniref:Uncharacterized protein n=1 Tax=Collybiopsis luxurians FD-317 M1 TaxID=944289 RepID=A0A0D0BVE5_9AGAR|nr:hypothetical protein GYMLUDRAFT_250207 [Collybiopsis luxurians FD-317 M1]